MNIEELLDAIIDKVPKNLVFWAIVWSLMLGFYFIESEEFILTSSFIVEIIFFILLILLILLESYFLYKIKDLDDEELKRLEIYITILYLVGDILAYYAYFIIWIWFGIFAIIVIILLLLEGSGKAKNDLFTLLLLLAIFLMILLIFGDTGVLLMLTMLEIQSVVVVLTYNIYINEPEPLGF
jgi:hypothetical protein